MAYEIRGLRELQRAVARNPQRVIERTGVFITRGLAEYRRIINRQPWQRGASGGGAPVGTGNLRDTHHQEVRNFEGRIYPTASYAKYVHGLPGYPRKRSYPLRPWLDYATDKARPAIQGHERQLLDDIVKDLAS